jgi:hypothetical protein
VTVTVTAMSTSGSWEYRELVGEIHECIRAHVPRGSVVLVASKGDEELTRIDGYRAWHFPRNDAGMYAGHYPADSVEAIGHLRHLFASGAQYLVFPWTSRWWLDHYGELAKHLHTAHALMVSQDDVCVIYQLRESAVFDAFMRLRERDVEPHLATGSTIELLGLAPPAARETMRVLTILARFGTEQYPHAEREIADIFARQMPTPTVDRTVIVVDNALPRDFVEERDGHILIGGDNSAREFSAFDRAVAFVGSDIWSYDLVHFATSAFNQLYVAYIERFDPRLLAAIAGQPACVGHIDCYNDPIDVRTYRSQHWIRTCFFMLPPAEVRALGSFVSLTAADDARCFSGDPNAPFRADAPISPRYREYITQWLTRGDIGQGVEWHSRFALTRETLPGFEQKARTILNEQLLGIRLRAMGCPLVDVTWLSARLRQQSPADIIWTTPWREQLAHRDRDAIRLADPRVENVEIAV